MVFIIPNSNVTVWDKDNSEYWIFNPKWEIVFQWDFKDKKSCIDKYTWWNTIQWKWKPSQGWKCKKISNK